jgi:hypothetical protein
MTLSARHGSIGESTVCEAVVLGEHDDPTRAPVRSVPDLLDDRSSQSKTGSPVENAHLQISRSRRPAFAVPSDVLQ